MIPSPCCRGSNWQTFHGHPIVLRHTHRDFHLKMGFQPRPSRIWARSSGLRLSTKNGKDVSESMVSLDLWIARHSEGNIIIEIGRSRRSRKLTVAGDATLLDLPWR